MILLIGMQETKKISKEFAWGFSEYMWLEKGIPKQFLTDYDVP